MTKGEWKVNTWERRRPRLHDHKVPIVYAILVAVLLAGPYGAATVVAEENKARADDAIPRLEAPERLVAIGDIHGEISALRKALVKAGAIDDKDAWTGGKMTVVITGDFLDRGDDELAIMGLFDRLQPEAEASGGRLLVLLGNHEVINVQLQFWCVTPAGYRTFAKLVPEGTDLEAEQFKGFPPVQRPRAAVFQPGGVVAKRLARYPFFAIVGDTVFVHGGIHPDHARYGLDRINRELHEWMRGESETVNEKLVDRTSAVWLRDYSMDPDVQDCARLAEALKLIGAKRMVVGHSIHDHVQSACDDQVWMIDTGMNAGFFGGPTEVLEIKGSEVRPIR